MKSGIKFQTFMAFTLLVQVVFAQEGVTKEQHHHGQANAHMNSMSFEQLVARFEASGRDQWQKPGDVVGSLGDLDGKTVVEIGSGTGYFSIRLAEAGAHVIAADVDQRFLDYIDQRKAERQLDDDQLITRLIPYDSPQLDIAEADLVLLVNVYHHIENREDYFKQVLAGIKFDGRLVIVDFKLIETTDGPPLSMRIPAEQVQKELMVAGFTRFKLNTEMLPFQYMLTAE